MKNRFIQENTITFKNGFTLIEILTYLALLSALFSIALPAFFLIAVEIERGERLASELAEVAYIERKIEKLISDTRVVVEPPLRETGGELHVVLIDFTQATVYLRDGYIYLNRAGLPEQMLNENALVGGLMFHHSTDHGLARTVGYSFSLGPNTIPTSTITIAKYDQ